MCVGCLGVYFGGGCWLGIDGVGGLGCLVVFVVVLVVGVVYWCGGWCG